MAQPTINRSYTVDAIYVKQKINRYQGNPLIEALPPPSSYEELARSLTDIPPCSAEHRDYPAEERNAQIGQLSSFMTVQERTVAVAMSVDTMIRSGYVGRDPMTGDHIKTFQRLYEARQNNLGLPAKLKRSTAQISSSLIGLSGMGKSSTLRRIAALYPPTIYHADLGITQVPIVHIEAPISGLSPKDLIHSILRRLDALIPDAHYGVMYGGVGKTNLGFDKLLNNCATVMTAHFVGLLIVDEAQNLQAKGTSKETLMAQLVRLSNELSVPILFVGTNQAAQMLGLTISSSRRASGEGFEYWGPLSSSGSLGDPDEWEDFLSALWPLQWTKNYVSLTDDLSALMFDRCQGVTDLAIKAFACAQWRAIREQSETIDATTLHTVFDNELRIMRPMVDALRDRNEELLMSLDSATRVDLAALEGRATSMYFAGQRRPPHRLQAPNSPMSATATSGPSSSSAKDARSACPDIVVQATSQPVSSVKTSAPAKKKSRTPKEKAKASDFPETDYRHAFHSAREGSNTVHKEMEMRGFIEGSDDILDAGT